MTLPPRLEAIRQRALEEIERTPRERSWPADAALLIGLEGLSTATAVLALEPDTFKRQGWQLGLALVVSFIGVGAALAAIRPGGRAGRRGVLTLLVPVLAVLVASASGLGTRTGVADELRCAASLGLASVVPAIVTSLLMARFAPSRTRALLGGVAAGAPGVVALHLHCPIGLELHIAAGHVAPWVVVAFLVVWLRSRLTTRSYAP